jgi:hypothetical protein
MVRRSRGFKIGPVKFACAMLTLLPLMTTLCTRLEAQTTASIRGTVRDEQGAVLPKATLTARQIDTNTTRTTVTGDAGEFYLPNLPAGKYLIKAELSGFAGVESTVELTIGREFELNLNLKLATVQSSVTVEEQITLLDTQHTVGEDIGIKEINDLPTLARDISGLAKLAPGVTISNYSGTNAGTGYSFGGQRQYDNNIQVDGATNVMQFYGRQANFFPQDWIQEFQVLTNSYPAEYGQSVGGMLNVITRSGTNEFHGRAYGYFRDATLDSPPWSGKYTNGPSTLAAPSPGVPLFLSSTPPYSQKRLGGFLGGPIVKDKLFFFLGYEYQDLGSTTVIGISQFWINQGVSTVIPQQTTQHAAVAKVDWNVSSKTRVNFRYANTALQQTNVSLNNSALDTVQPRYTWGGPLWNINGAASTTLSSNAFNEARVYYGINKPWIICNLAGAGGSDLLARGSAITGIYSSRSYPGATFGCTSFDGLEGESNLTLSDNFSLIKGHHRIKAGVDVQRMTIFMNVEDSEKGQWTFLTDSLFDINNPTTYPSAYSVIFGSPIVQAAHWNPGLFVQDSWQIIPSLMLNIGARYDIDYTSTEGNQFINSYNQNIISKSGGGPILQHMQPDKKDIAPRGGFVWAPTADKKTTFHGGFGMFYTQNHFNYNDSYEAETLETTAHYAFNYANPTLNPFWTSSNPATGEAQLRAFLAQNYPALPALGNLPTLPNSIYGLNSHVKNEYTTQISVGVAHQFRAGFHVEANYIRTQGHGILVAEDINLAQNAQGQYYEKDPRFSAITMLDNVGWIKYNALQTRADYRWQKLTLGGSYTLSKATSNDVTNITGGSATNPLNLNIDIGPDNSDRRNNFVSNVAYALPWGFSIAALGTYRSPLPFSITNSTVVYARVAPKNNQRGDSEKDMDIRFSKVFRFKERFSASLYWEMYNALNDNNWAGFTGSQLSSNYLRPLQELPKRQQQGGFQFEF